MPRYKALIVDDRDPENIVIRETGFDGPFEFREHIFESVCAMWDKDSDINHSVYMIVPRVCGALKVQLPDSNCQITYRLMPRSYQNFKTTRDRYIVDSEREKGGNDD